MTSSEKLALAREMGEKLRTITDLIHTEVIPSDKLGQDFRVTYIGSAEIAREYIDSESATGTEDSPYEWADGIDLIPNAFYNVDGVRYVYMGAASIASDDNKPTGDSDADFGNGWTQF